MYFLYTFCINFWLIRYFLAFICVFFTFFRMHVSAKAEIIKPFLDGLAFQYHSGSYDQDTAPHRREERLFPFTVIVCPTRGEYSVVINGQKRTAGPHKALVVPPGIIHDVEVKERCRLQHAHVFFGAFHSLDLLSFFNVPTIIGGQPGASLEKLVRELSRFFKTADNAKSGIADFVRIKRVGFQILEEIVGRSKLKKETYGFLLGLQKIKPALDHINSHAHEAVATETLAALLKMPPNPFKKLFFSVMRKTPLQYIRQFRIQKARNLLSADDVSVKEVAAQTGYRTIFYFSRDFKKATGISPLDYRRSCRLALAQFHR